MEITEEQFLRGITAIRAHDALQKAVSAAYRDAGEERVDSIGTGMLHSELLRQLEERCGDAPDRYGSMIQYMLYDAGGPVTEQDGSARMVNTPELLWQYWRETSSGPFA